MIHRTHQLFSFVAFALVTTASVVSAHAQTWVYDESEGGWKDIQTGLVWYDYGAGAYYPEAQTLTSQLVLFGCDDWRLPTVAEMQTAVAHGIKDNVPLYGVDTASYLWFSANTQGKKKIYTVDLRSGNVQVVLNTSWLCFACVRQGSVE